MNDAMRRFETLVGDWDVTTLNSSGGVSKPPTRIGCP
jgi:hypothetical protein